MTIYTIQAHGHKWAEEIEVRTAQEMAQLLQAREDLADICCVEEEGVGWNPEEFIEQFAAKAPRVREVDANTEVV